MRTVRVLDEMSPGFRPRRVAGFVMRAKKGACRVCGKEFTGPPNRKLCDDHSKNVQITGRGSVYDRDWDVKGAKL